MVEYEIQLRGDEKIDFDLRMAFTEYSFNNSVHRSNRQTFLINC